MRQHSLLDLSPEVYYKDMLQHASAISQFITSNDTVTKSCYILVMEVNQVTLSLFLTFIKLPLIFWYIDLQTY